MRRPDRGLIDRSKTLRFRFDGRDYSGFAGDTLASALLANGISLVGRSFKYHRPRGILTAGAEEPNALVTVGEGAYRDPNVRATTLELLDGLTARAQNCWPSRDFDLLSVNDRLGKLLAAGFYYKTFMWPSSFWERLYEPLIRRAAGLGALSGAPDPDICDGGHLFCDLLVIGAGPAGLAAALAAARAGARVLLVEQDWLLGGRLLAEQHEIDGQPASLWAAAVESELAGSPNVEIFRRTILFGAYDGGFGAVERLRHEGCVARDTRPRERLHRIFARRTVLAAGAVERMIAFGGNDRPGVMLTSAVRTYLNRFAVAPGRRAAVFASSDQGLALADELREGGMEVQAVIDPTKGAEVVATHGRHHLTGIDVRDAENHISRIEVDLLAIGGGWSPNVGIATHLGGRSNWSDVACGHLVDEPPAGMAIAGAAAGQYGLREALHSGSWAGADAARELGFPTKVDLPDTSEEPASARPHFFVKGSRGKAFVDFQHDVTLDDVALAVREGFVSVEHFKRYTTFGMGTDQGRTGQVVGHGALAQLTGRTLGEVGTIRARSPCQPIAIAAFAGPGRGAEYRPVRRTPSHAWAEEQGATFTDVDLWKRAQWFAKPGERDWLETVEREVRSVREGVGVCDVSTLGKLDLHGAEVGTLLDRLYINHMSNLGIGRCRYGVMLREDGMVFDDGVVARLSEDRWFLSTTTVNADKVIEHIDHSLAFICPGLHALVMPVTEQWAGFAVAGPRSRELMQRLVPELDFGPAAFRPAAVREVQWRGAAARILRMSYSGERAYEFMVPADRGDSAIRVIMAAGEQLGVTPYGTEAMGIMRIEKGHIAGGELDGRTTAADLGLASMISPDQPFIGLEMSMRPGLTDPNRPSMVGILGPGRHARLFPGAHLLPMDSEALAANGQGVVTSAYYSPEMGAWIGLALVRRGRERMGEHLRTFDPMRGGETMVEICHPVFVDPAGDRMRG